MNPLDPDRINNRRRDHGNRGMNPRLAAKGTALAMCTALAMLGATWSMADTYSVTGDVNDALVNHQDPEDGGGFYVGDGTQPTLVAGRFQDIMDRTPVFPFDLPALRGGTITSATLTLVLRHYLAATHNGDLYGLTRTNSSSAVLTNDFFEGALDGANTRLADNFVTPSGTVYWVEEPHSNSGPGLINWLNAQYAAFGGGHDFNDNDDFIFFRVSPDTTAMPDSVAYDFEAADTGTAAYRPLLTLDVKRAIGTIIVIR